MEFGKLNRLYRQQQGHVLGRAMPFPLLFLDENLSDALLALLDCQPAKHFEDPAP